MSSGNIKETINASHLPRNLDTFEKDVLRLADQLQHQGVSSNDRVMLTGDNSYDYVVVLFALLQMETTPILIDDKQTPEEISEIFARVRAVHSLKVSKRVGKGNIGVATLTSDGKNRAVLSIAGESQSEKGYVADGINTTEDVGLDSGTSCSGDFAGLPGTHPLLGATRLSLWRWYRQREGVILWSSGSTGKPKGVVKSGRSIFDNAARTIRRMNYNRSDVLMPLLPFSHQYGFSMLIIWWLMRCSLVIAPYRMIHRVVKHIRKTRATVVDATPATYHCILSMLRGHSATVEHLRGVRMWCVGGSPLSEKLADQFESTIGHPLLDGYGLTETGNVALASSPARDYQNEGDAESNVHLDRRKDAVLKGHRVADFRSEVGYSNFGLPLLQDVRLRVADEEGRPMLAGHIGEVWISTPELMEGYLGRDGQIEPVDTAGTGWFATGDLGCLDSRGKVRIIGRNQAVHRYGYTLYPAAIEQKLDHMKITVKIVAEEAEAKGQRLIFFVEDPWKLDVQYWRKRICVLLPTYEHPDIVRVVEAFPLNRNGKLDTESLRSNLQLTESSVVAERQANCSAEQASAIELAASPHYAASVVDRTYPDPNWDAVGHRDNRKVNEIKEEEDG